MQESFPDARRLIEAGEMIPDTLVGDLLLEALLLDEPGLQDDLGFVVDGFPRTACQVRINWLCGDGFPCLALGFVVVGLHQVRRAFGFVGE
jgi:hypothetical protein